MPASLLLLVAAWERPTVRGLRRAPAVLALVVALTVAQPFGVVASKQEGDAPRPPPRPEPSPLSPAQSNGDDVHVARLFGLVPVLPFRFYQREKPLSGLAENTPNKTLRIRSWFWLPILTNATRVADTCSEDVLTPCWEPGYPYGKELTVYRRGGSQWATLYNPPGEGSGGCPDTRLIHLEAQRRSRVPRRAGLLGPGRGARDRGAPKAVSRNRLKSVRHPRHPTTCRVSLTDQRGDRAHQLCEVGWLRLRRTRACWRSAGR